MFPTTNLTNEALTLVSGPVIRLGFENPVCQIVVSVRHVDEPLDEVGALNKTQEHLKEMRKLDGAYTRKSACCRRFHAYLRETRYVQVLPMIDGGFARLPRPGPLPLCVCETGPGEDVVIGQVQIGRVHRELTDQLQQAGETVQQPLQRET